jgi:hypothetical protein
MLAKGSIMRLIVPLLAACFARAALGQEFITFTNRVVTFTNIQGKPFRDVRLIRADMDGIIYRSTDGIGGGSVSYMNLSPVLLQAFGIPTNFLLAAKTHAERNARRSQTNNALLKIDLMLAQHWGSDLKITTNLSDHLDYKSKHGTLWSLDVEAKQLSFGKYEWAESEDGKSRKDFLQSLNLYHGQQDSIKLLFDKFLQWEAIAATNNAEPFTKEMGVFLSPDATFFFEWGGGAMLSAKTRVYHDYLHFDVGKKDILHFLELLKNVPAMREELAQKILSRERHLEQQKGLFR